MLKKLLELKGKFEKKFELVGCEFVTLINNQRGKITLSFPFKEFRTDAWVHSYVQPIVRKPIHHTFKNGLPPVTGECCFNCSLN